MSLPTTITKVAELEQFMVRPYPLGDVDDDCAIKPKRLDRNAQSDSSPGMGLVGGSGPSPYNLSVIVKFTA